MTTAKGPVMFVAAHPDDPEFLAGGTIARLVREGREVTYLIVTDGSKGSSDPDATPAQVARVRADEQRRAAEALGVRAVEFLGYRDGELEDTREVRRDVTRAIRRFRPELVITLNPQRAYTSFAIWHRDHRTTGRVVMDCVYPLARDHLAFPELSADHPPHVVREVSLVQWDRPSLVIDITETFDAKLAALRCHASQVGDFTAVETRVRNRAAMLGQAQGYAFAEGFDHVVVPG